MTDAQLIRLVEFGAAIAGIFIAMIWYLFRLSVVRVCSLCEGAGKSVDGIRCAICGGVGYIK